MFKKTERLKRYVSSAGNELCANLVNRKKSIVNSQ